jgi:phospholipid-transporting ATPase
MREEAYLRNKFPLFYYVGQRKTIFTIPNYLFWAT